MSQKTNNRKMRRGFMCNAQASTAVCMSSRDPRSVIVPRRLDRSMFLDDTRLINFAKYSKLVQPHRLNPPELVQPHRLNPPENKSVSLIQPKIKLQREQDQEHELPESIQKTPVDRVFQVVVMRVAIHCQGCAGKVKKHLSKMEGVTSFSIDLESKRVTVMGHVSPVGVLESISKVKKAEFWTC